MKSVKRFLYICKTLFPPLVTYLLYHDHPKSQHYLSAMTRLRIGLQRLGPTFIKFGQLLSARPDLIGYDLANEFRNLLDSEPIIPFTQILVSIDTELKESHTNVFKKIDEVPLATASIAQVHRATLKNNKAVAIKVQRAGIAMVIHNDLPLLKHISKLLDSTLHIKGLKFVYVYTQFEDWILHELDFQIEGRRADKFKENMKDIPGVNIPSIYWKYATEKMLVMEYAPGYTLNHLLNLMQEKQVKTLYDLKIDMKINPDLLITRVIHAIAKQTLVDGFFHGDLHPANIIVGKNNEITFVDFGIVGTLNQEEKTQILLCMLAIVESDPQSLEKVLTSIIADPMTPDEVSDLHQELSDELHKLHEDVGGKITLNHVLTMLMPLSAKYHVMWSAGFMLAFKSIAQIDSVASAIGLKTPLVDLMKPEVEKAVTLSFSSNLSKENAYKNIMDLLQAGKRLPETLSELEDVIQNTKLTKGMMATASHAASLRGSLILGSAMVVVAPFVVHFPLSSTLKTLLFIFLPLLFVGIIVKIFTIGRK